jgi:phospholipid/cholesterol/gamma-HCH transport system permease protein
MGTIFTMNTPLTAAAKFNIQHNILTFSGHWTVNDLKAVEQPLEQIHHQLNDATALIFDGGNIEKMDTAGAWLIMRTRRDLEHIGKSIQLHNFRVEHRHLLNLITNYPFELPKPHATFSPLDWLAELGERSIRSSIRIIHFLAFIGETFLSLLHTLSSPSRLRWQALFSNLHSAGITALPIVGLMAFLIGIVLAYQGGTQLEQYGANIFIVDLVGVTLLRELAPLLTAIIIAGRSGSAYTAQIGTMRITEEIDALRTLGITPMELLVLPKLLALIILLPLLSAFADIMGVIGGMLIAKLSLGISVTDFLDRFPKAVSITHYLIGIGKAPVFAAVIATVSCYQGFQVQGSADSVGRQVTRSVVQAIFLVIVVDAIFSILFNLLNI